MRMYCTMPTDILVAHTYVRNRRGSIRTRMARATELYSDKPQYWPTRGDFIVRGLNHTLTLLANVARGVTICFTA